MKLSINLSIFSSVQFRPSVVSNFFRPRGLQHTRLPRPSLTPGAYSNSCPSSRWCHPTYYCLSPTPPAFNLSKHQGLFKWVNSSHQVTKILGFQLQHQSLQWIFRTDFRNGWISLQSKELSRVFSNTTVSKASFLQHSVFFIVQLSHPCMTTGKTFVGKIVSLLFNMLSRLVITFLPRSIF